MAILLAMLGSPVNAAPEPAQQSPHFDILEYTVSGNTLLERTLIERIVYQHLGEQKGIDAVEQARQALEQAYRDAGYPTVFVDIPEQDVQGGVVRLQVTEGRIERLRISGSRYYSLGKITAEVPSLAAGGIPKMENVQAELEQINRASPDRSVAPVLRAGKTPGTVEVELKVKDRVPLHGSLEINNRNTADTTTTRTMGSLRYDNLWQKFHSVSAQYQTAPENTDEVQVFAGTYVMPFLDANSKLAFYAVKSSSDVATVSDLAVIGDGNIYGVRAVFPFAAQADFFHSLTLGADYKDFNESLTLQGSDTLNTPISYLPFSLRYEAMRRSAASHTTRLGVGTTFSLRGVGNDQQEFEDKRFLARNNFMHLNADLEHTQVLSRGFHLRGRIEGQLADSPLISNEQYSAGGADSVRGYRESQALGDDGISGTVELQTANLIREGWTWPGELTALAFVDGASLRVREPLAGQTARYVLSSAGAGLRFDAWSHLTGSLDLAWPFHANGDIEAGEERVHFRLAYEF
ncbi:MAG: ShlB/FhaC/HecB family hemolysin secretion/activation protein [Gammaproteobacteria bacterium]|nr:ShlB/FhaC/HecB family hemolysin secretion/activation protein [Gammaproteobacteria bacterium]